MEEKKGGVRKHLAEIAEELKRKVTRSTRVQRVYDPKAAGGRRPSGKRLLKIGWCRCG
jgi:hypothetical protein